MTAYCRTFQPGGNVGLILKISRANGRTLQSVFDQANEVLGTLNQSMSQRADIVVVDDAYSTAEMATLYRSVDAFVLPSRGEGWGRPLMEAMASGLPTIGTNASGNIDFMSTENSVLIDVQLNDVPRGAVEEIPVYTGHRWYEPDIASLSEQMKAVVNDENLRNRISAHAIEHIQSHHDLVAGMNYVQEAVSLAEHRFRKKDYRPPQPTQIKVTWEGEFFACAQFFKY